MKVKISIFLKIVVILLLYRSSATAAQEVFNVTYWDKYIFSIICCCILFIAIIAKSQWRFPINMTITKIAYLFFMPIVIGWMYSVIVSTINPVPYAGFVTRSFSNVAFQLLSILQGLLLFIYFGNAAVEIMFFSYVASFMTSVVVTLMRLEISQVISMVFDSGSVGSIMELNEIIPAIALFFLYYLYQYRYCGLSKRNMLIREAVCLFVLIFGTKRIVLLALLIVIGIYLVLHKRTEKITRWSNIITFTLIGVIYLYLYSIKSGFLFSLIDKFNINDMGRKLLWDGIQDQYSFSPLYMGRGLGYTAKWMDNNWDTIRLPGLNQTTGLHNDILKYFIDFGFWGMGLYLYAYLKIVTSKISKISDANVAFIYFLFMVFQILCWFTDNISTYHIFMMPFFLLMFSLLSDAKRQQIIFKL